MKAKLLLSILFSLHLYLCEATGNTAFLQIDINSAVVEISNTLTSLQTDIKNLRSEMNGLGSKVDSKVNQLADNRESLKKFIDDSYNSISARQCTYEYKILSIRQWYTLQNGCGNRKQITNGYYSLNEPAQVIGFYYCCNW